MKKNFAINFDLYTDKKTRDEYKLLFNKDITSLYDIIGSYLKENDFHWVQGSGYITNKAISSEDLDYIIRKLYNKYDYLARYTRDIKRTIVDDKTYDYDKFIKTKTKLFYKKYENSIIEFNKQNSIIPSAQSIRDKYKNINIETKKEEPKASNINKKSLTR